LFLVIRVLRFSVHRSGLSFSLILRRAQRFGVDLNPEPLNPELLNLEPVVALNIVFGVLYAHGGK
jgi:hypothetical protein